MESSSGKKPTSRRSSSEEKAAAVRMVRALRAELGTIKARCRGSRTSPAFAQQQLSHAKLATTEAHYLQLHMRGLDVRAALEKFAAGKMPAESISH